MEQGVQDRLRIVVVEKDRERALMIVDGFRDAGDHEVSVLGDETGLARKLKEIAPDIVLIDLEQRRRAPHVLQPKRVVPRRRRRRPGAVVIASFWALLARHARDLAEAGFRRGRG